MPVPQQPEPAFAGARPSQLLDDPLDRDGVLPVAPNQPFFFAHYPMNPRAWRVAIIEDGPDAGAWWLPVLQRRPCRPGLCGHRTRGRGQPQAVIWEDSHKRVRHDGGVVLPQSLGYMREADCIDPLTKTAGTYYMEVWESPKPKLQGQRQKFDCDRQMMYRLMLDWIRQGHLHPPHPAVVDANVARLAQRVERREAINPAGEFDRKDALVQDAAEDVELAQDARIPETYPRVAAPVSEAPAPSPAKPATEYQRLKAEAKALGYKVGGLKTSELRDIVEAGVPAPEGD